MAALYRSQRTATSAAVFQQQLGTASVSADAAATMGGFVAVAAAAVVVGASAAATMGSFTPSMSASVGITAASAATMGGFVAQATAALAVTAAASALMDGFSSSASAAVTGDSVELLTLSQAEQYLMMALGVELPQFIVQAAIEKAAPYVPAMVDAGYSHADQVMVLCISVALIAAAGMPRRLGNQAAPSGASRGFKYTERDLWALRRSLAALDTAGIMTSVVGPDPTAVAMFMVIE